MSEAAIQEVNEALKSALYRLKQYDYQAMQGTIAKVEKALQTIEKETKQ